jgi:type I restriction enzyme S subunit
MSEEPGQVGLDEVVEEYAEEDRKETDGWRTVKLSDVTRKRAENVDAEEIDGERHVGLEHIEPNTPEPDWEDSDELSSTKRRFYSGDILFAKLRPNLEKAAQPDFDGVSSTDIFTIEADDGVNSKYLLYRLSSKPAYDHARRTSVGTRMPRTSWNLFSNFEFDLPPLPEQRKIASVLYNVDEAIRKAEEIIEGTKRLEKGAIQSVLSDGTKDRTAKKQTPIGEIPEEWEVRQVKELTDVTVGYVQTIDGHFTDSESGVRLFRTQDISARGLQTDEEIYVTRQFHEDNKGSQVYPGDLIVSRHGDSGQAAVVPDSLDEAHSQNVVVIRSSDAFLSEFLEYLFNYETTRQRLLAWKAGSVQKVVSTTAVQNFRIPLPPIDEQKEIVENLSSIRDRLANEQDYLDRLHRLKRALMQDLLTGEVRTKDRDIDVLPEVEAQG